MQNALKLSNYLFRWFLHKYERYILTITLGITAVLLFCVGNIHGNDLYEHYGREFRTFDLVVDYSGAGLIFLLGLVALFASIFIFINGLYTNGKGMYTILTLPLKRHEVFFSFFFYAFSAVLLYFAAWLILMVILYSPVSAIYENAASKAVLNFSEDIVFKDLDTSITNGFFLAFHRSIFLSSCFPVSGIQSLALWSGIFLSTISIVFAGIYNEHIFVRVGLFMVVLGGFYAGFYQGWVFLKNQLFYSSQTVMPAKLYFAALTAVLGVGFIFAAVYKLKHRKEI